MTEENKDIIKKTCSFCSREADPEAGRILIEGKDEICICTSCLDDCVDLVKQYRKDPIEVLTEKDSVRPSQILEFLNDYVVGQEHAKKVLSVAVANHYKFLSYKQQEKPEVELEKSNVCLVGPTGSGKTYIIKAIAKMLNVPFAMADATSITQSGYVGEDPENIIRALVDAADGDIEKAQRGIVYIDEIDKLSRKSENLSISRDVGGEGVQQALLKIIEGAEIEVANKGQRKHPLAETFKIDTSNILFIVGGSFEGIEKIIQKRNNKSKSGIGFGAAVSSKEEVKFNDHILDIKAEDLKKFGMLPELLGRLPIICPLQELSVEALESILTEPKNALIKQYQELFKFDGIELEFEEEAIKEVARLAIERKTGARSLRSIMEETLLPYMYSLPDESDIEKVVFTKETILNEGSPIITRKKKEAS